MPLIAQQTCLLLPVSLLISVFTARCYDSVVYSVIVCSSVCLSVSHKSKFYEDG